MRFRPAQVIKAHWGKSKEGGRSQPFGGSICIARHAGRLADVGNMQPIWKLYGNGCVGSQALLGIPRLTALRNDQVLAPVSRVWPFETGLLKLPPRAKRDHRIIYAEIYPSLVPIQRAVGEVKDAAQVKTMAGHFAALDDVGELSTLFAGPSHLSSEMRETIEFEEGWALGVASGPSRT